MCSDLTGRHGLMNLQMVDHLLMRSTVPECLHNDPEGCELDYMKDREIQDYISEMQNAKDGTDAWAEDSQIKLENDIRYLKFVERI